MLQRLVQSTAQDQAWRVGGAFAERTAQLTAILKLLCLVEDGEHLDITAPLHRHARTLILHR